MGETKAKFTCDENTQKEPVVDLRPVRWVGHPRGRRKERVEFGLVYPLGGARDAAKRAAGLLGGEEGPFSGELVVKQLGTRERSEWRVEPYSFRLRRVDFLDYHLEQIA